MSENFEMLVNVIAQVASLSPSWLVCTLQAPLPRSLWRCFFAFNKRVSSWSTILCWNRLCRWRRIHLEAVVQVCCSCFQNDQWSVKLLHHQTSLCKTQRQQKNFVNLGLLPRGCCGFTLFEVKETDTNACIALQHKRKRCCETQV